MEEAQAALAASIRSLTEADQRQRAPAAIRTNSQAPRQASPHMMQHRQPLSPHMQQNSVQPGHVQRAAQFLQPRSPAAMQSQPMHAVASASHPAHASNQAGSYGFQPHQLPPVSQQHVQPSMGQPASEWRSVADVPQRQVSFDGAPQRQPQPGPTAATSSAYNRSATAATSSAYDRPATATTNSACNGPATGGGVARSLSGPEAYWPPGEHAGPGTRQQLSRSSNSSLAVQSPHAFSAGAGTAAQAFASGSGRSFDGLGGIVGGSPTSQQRYPAAAELALEASLPASPISGDEGSLLGKPW